MHLLLNKMRITIKTPYGEVAADLNYSETSKELFGMLPIRNSANTWGDEIYFETPIDNHVEREYRRQEMEIGDLAYWPQGKAFCIFFGKTPMSKNENPMAASDVTFLGKVKGIENNETLEILKKVQDSDEIRIVERVEE